MGYGLLADLTMFVHFTFLACVVFGGLLALKWPRVIWAHLLLAVWGFSTIAFSIRCPLSEVEDWARARAGEAQLTGTGFIDHYLEGVLYPEKYTPLVQAVAAVVMGGSWLSMVTRRRSQRVRLACDPRSRGDRPAARTNRSQTGAHDSFWRGGRPRSADP